MRLWYTASVIAYGAVLSLEHSIVMALWSFAFEEEHQERFFSSTHNETLPSVPNAIVAAGLAVCAGKAAADALRRKLTDNTVRRNAVNTVGTLPGMVRA